MPVGEVVARWQATLAAAPEAQRWLQLQADLGLAPRTVEAYGRALADYLAVCAREHIDPVQADRSEVARYVRDLTARPHPRGGNLLALDSGRGLANATLQQRLVAVRLFYDYTIEEGWRQTNPVGRGRYTPGRGFGGHRDRGLVPRFTKLPWIPTDEEWKVLLQAARDLSIRDRFMLALAYDAGLRREELCQISTSDLDPAHRTLRVRAETTKNRQGRVVPYSASTGVLLQAYLAHRRTITTTRGRLFVSESHRNPAEPISVWSWSKVVRRLGDGAGLPRFSTHTLRHLCLTDLARCGWDIHAIARFAGHRTTDTTLQYIHLSGRDLAAKLEASMAGIHALRVEGLEEWLS
jgi:site-specific recombinase XerD